MSETGSFIEYVYFSKARIESHIGGIDIIIPLLESLLGSGRYTIIYETRNVVILKGNE
jgi:hypothetical protein